MYPPCSSLGQWFPKEEQWAFLHPELQPSPHPSPRWCVRHRSRSLQDPMPRSSLVVIWMTNCTTSSRNQSSGFLLGFPQQLRWAWRVVQPEWHSPELLCPGRTSPSCPQVGSVMPDPHAERHARIPPLLRVVPMHEAACPHSQSSHETNWREHTVQWVADSSPLTQSSFHSIPLFIYLRSFMAAWLRPDGRCLHMFLLSRTWGLAATSLFTVIFSSDTTRTPTLSGRLSAKNKTKLF